MSISISNWKPATGSSLHKLKSISKESPASILAEPKERVVGLSKLARLVEVFAKRLQIQEKLTAQIANAVDEVLQPKGVGVIIEASHLCVATRGIRKPESRMVTSRMLGSFRTDEGTRKEFLDLVGYNKSKF